MRPIAELRKRPWGVLELALAAALIAWRCAAPTWHPVWMDVVFYLGVYWIFLVLAPEEASTSWVSIGLSLILLTLYLKQQMPHLMDTLGILP